MNLQESSLFLSGANPEDLMENKFMRSQGFFDPNWAGYGANTNYLGSNGGLFLRGYSGYLAPDQTSDGTIYYTYRGTSGASINTELYFNRFFNIKSNYLKKYFKLESYLFGDVGVIGYEINTNSINMSDFRADAGLGFSLTIKKWWILETTRPLTLNFDIPFFLNKIPATEEKYFNIRFIIRGG